MACLARRSGNDGVVLVALAFILLAGLDTLLAPLATAIVWTSWLGTPALIGVAPLSLFVAAASLDWGVRFARRREDDDGNPGDSDGDGPLWRPRGPRGRLSSLAS